MPKYTPWDSAYPESSRVTHGEDANTRWVEVSIRLEQEKSTGNLNVRYGSSDTDVTFKGGPTWAVSDSGTARCVGDNTTSQVEFVVTFEHDDGDISLVSPEADPWG